MSDIIHHYPEVLRDMHDTIADAISGEEPTAAASAVAVHVVEWIRRHWGGRTLTRKWWGLMQCGEVDHNTAPLVEAAADPVRSLRGRELREAAWDILAAQPSLWQEHGWRQVCQIANLIAATVEAEWTRTCIYIPTGKEVERAMRDAAIWRKFKYGNTQELDGLIDTFKLSQRQIYDITRRVQNDRDRREQPTLPGF